MKQTAKPFDSFVPIYKYMKRASFVIYLRVERFLYMFKKQDKFLCPKSAGQQM